MKKYPIKIRIKTGTLIVYANRERPYAGKCHRCGQVIYFVKTILSKKILMSVSDGEYISHFLTCPAFNKKKKYAKRNI